MFQLGHLIPKPKYRKSTKMECSENIPDRFVPTGNDIAKMKGASAWLNALPLKDEGYVLNKREFFDALSLRYRWPLSRLPSKCNGCGKDFDVDHAMNCTTGGFIHHRHDDIRDVIAKIVDGVAYDVRTEPPLQPLTGEKLSSTNKDEGACLDKQQLSNNNFTSPKYLPSLCTLSQEYDAAC